MALTTKDVAEAVLELANLGRLSDTTRDALTEATTPADDGQADDDKTDPTASTTRKGASR